METETTAVSLLAQATMKAAEKELTRMNYEIYEVPNDTLDDGTEEFIEEFTDELEALEFSRSYRTIASVSVWVVIASDENGYEKVIST